MSLLVLVVCLVGIAGTWGQSPRWAKNVVLSLLTLGVCIYLWQL